MVNWGNFIYAVVMAVASVWIAARLFGCFFEKKEDLRLYHLACAIYFIYQIYFTQISLETVNVARALVNLPLLMFIIVSGYKSRGKEKYFLLVMYYVVESMLEILSLSLLNTICRAVVPERLDRLKDTIPRVAGVIPALVFFILIYILSVKWDKKQKGILPNKFFLCLLFVPTGSLCILIIQYYTEGTTINSVVVLGILILFNIVVFEIYRKMSETYSRKIEQEMVERQIAMYRNEFEIIQESDRRIRTLRHDLKKHMLLLSKYVESGRLDEANTYVQQIYQEALDSREYIRTGNNGVDSILNYMLASVEQLNFKPRVMVQVPESSFMLDFDLNVVLGNLLENALEALEKVEEQSRSLDLQISYQKGVLYIRVGNAYDGNVRKRGDVYLTTKQEEGEHGLGLPAIWHVVEKYRGEMDVRDTEGMFWVDVILYVHREEANEDEPDVV